MSILEAEGTAFELTIPVVVVGAGACGLCAALAAHDAGTQVLVLERDATPQGSTALSSGMIPASGTRLQRATGIDDSVELMAADIQRKARDQADPAIVEAVCRQSGPTIDWLAERHAVAFELVEGFLYPGHSRLRMHAPASRRGADLIGALIRAAETAGVPVVTNARVTALYAEADGTVRGLRFERPNGCVETLGCGALV